MDWATFFQDYAVVITAVSGLILAILGYIFGRWDAIQKRKWALEDREYNQRLERKEKRIAEAQAYVDTQHNATQKLAKFELGLIRFGKEIPANLREDFAKIPQLTEFTSKRVTSLLVFGDLSLAELDREITTLFNMEYTNAVELFENTLRAKPVDRKVAETRVEEFYRKITALFVKVQSRLEEVAEKNK
jgi:hypothetical protein